MATHGTAAHRMATHRTIIKLIRPSKKREINTHNIYIYINVKREREEQTNIEFVITELWR